MLAIRMQRTGRKGYASFRVVVQDSRFTPTSGRVVAKLGHHNPHTKETVIDKDLASKYLNDGAQPSPRVVRLFELEKISLPKWVEKPRTDKQGKIKNPDKLRKHQPSAPEAETPAEEPAPEADSTAVTDGDTAADADTVTEEKTEAAS